MSLTSITKDFVVKSGIVSQGTNAVTSSTAQTGTLQVSGGASIAKNIVVGSTATIYGDSTLVGTLQVGGGSTFSDIRVTNAATATTLVITGQSTLQNLRAAVTTATLLNATDLVKFTSNVAADANGNGALQVTGGVYLGNNLFVNSAASSASSTLTNSIVTMGGIGAFGDLRIGGNAVFSGNVTVLGTQTIVNSSATSIVDPVIDIGTAPLNAPLTVPDGLNKGFVIHYYESQDQHMFFGRNVNNGHFIFKTDVAPGLIDIPNSYYVSSGTYATVDLGSLIVNDIVGAVSTNTGALIVKGGIGVAEGAFIGGKLTATSVVISSGINSAGLVYQGADGSLLSQSYITFDNINNRLQGTITRSNSINGGNTGYIPIQTSPGVTSFIAAGTSDNQVLTWNQTYNTATWASAAGTSVGSATTASNLGSGTTGQVPFQAGPGSTNFFGPGSAGQILVSAGASVTGPVFTSTSSIYVNSARYADNLTGGSADQFAYQTGANATAFMGTGTMYVGNSVQSEKLKNGGNGSLVYQSAPNTTSFLNTGTPGQLLVAGVGAPAFTNTSSIGVGFVGNPLTAGAGISYSAGTTYDGSAAITISLNTTTLVASAITANNIANGTAGQVPYQTAPGVTSFYGPGTAGNILVSNGTSAPTYNNTLTLAGTTPTSSAATGALQVAGGVGIGGGLVVGGTTTATNIEAGGGGFGSVYLTQFGSVFGEGGVSTSNVLIQASANNLAAGIGIATLGGGQSLYSSGAINFTTNRTLRDRDTPQGGNTFMSLSTSGVLTLSGNVATTATTNGTLVVTGGVGISGGLNVGGVVTATTFVGNLTGLATTATSLSGGGIGSLVYQSAASTTAYLTLGSTGYVLTAGGSAPQWTSISSLVSGNATTATNIAGGTTGSIPYQVSEGITQFIPIGTNGSLLVSNGTTATFSNTLATLNVNGQSTFAGVTATIITATTLVVSGNETVAGTLTVTNNTQADDYGRLGGAIITSGGIRAAKNITAGGIVVAGQLLAETKGTVVPAFFSNNHLVASFTSDTIVTTGQQNLDYWSATQFRSAKYLVQITDTVLGGGKNVHVTEIMVMHDGTNAYMSEYGVVTNNGELGTFDATLASSQVTLKFTPTAPTSMIIEVIRTSINANPYWNNYNS